MMLIKKILRLPQASYCWVRALNLSAHERFDEALCALNRNEMISSGNNPEFHLLRGLLYSATGKYEMAVKEQQVAMRLIPSKRHYNEDEKKYLIAYAANVCARSFVLENKQDEAEKMFHLFKDQAIDLNKVSKNLKTNFPLGDAGDAGGGPR